MIGRAVALTLQYARRFETRPQLNVLALFEDESRASNSWIYEMRGRTI
jgi:hypothetical protein